MKYYQEKSKDVIIKELKVVQQNYSSLKATFEIL